MKGKRRGGEEDEKEGEEGEEGEGWVSLQRVED